MTGVQMETIITANDVVAFVKLSLTSVRRLIMQNVEFDPNADCLLWKQFVREIMGYKADLIKFVQTAAGWSLSGDISEQTMFILYGTGANGKSMFLNTIMHLLGDYALATPTETFMKKSGDNYFNDVARLRVPGL